MNEPTQPTSDLLNLPLDQQIEIANWLLGGLPYFHARKLAKDKFNLAVLPDSSWKTFWEQACLPQLTEKRQRMAEAAAHRMATAKLDSGQFAEATADILQQQAFELVANPAADRKEMRATMLLLLKVKDLELRIEQHDLAREKYEFDAAAACLSLAPEIKGVASSNLSETEKVDKLRLKLFGYLGGKRLPHDQLLPTPTVEAEEVGGEIPPAQS